MKTLTIRGMDDELIKTIKETSKNQNESMNQTILKLIKKGAGIAEKSIFPTYNDLDDLAGTWSAEDEEIFNKSIQGFEEVDEEMWK